MYMRFGYNALLYNRLYNVVYTIHYVYCNNIHYTLYSVYCISFVELYPK